MNRTRVVAMISSIATVATLTNPMTAGANEALVSGLVLAGNGKGIEGAEVHVAAFPPDEQLASLHPEDTYDITWLAGGLSTSDGSYAIGSTNATGLEPFAGHDGLADLVVFASKDGQSIGLPYYFSVEVPTLPEADITVEDPSPEVDGFIIDLSSNAALTGIRGRTIDAEASSGVSEEPSEDIGELRGPRLVSLHVPSPAAVITRTSSGCSSKMVEDHGARSYAVNGIYNYNTKGTVTYQAQSTSELGVGVSSSGKYGEWKQQGTVARTTTSTVEFPSTTGTDMPLYFTKYRWGKYRDHTLVYGPGGTYCHFLGYGERPYQFAAGASKASRSSRPQYPKSNCVGFMKGSKFETTTAKAITWTDGVKIKAVLGIDLSSKSGYSTSTKVRYEMVNQAVDLCGRNASPGSAADIVAIYPSYSPN